MSSLAIEDVKQLMKNQNNIRNVTIISSANHGKTTLTNVLSSKAQIIIAGKVKIFFISGGIKREIYSQI